MANFKSDELNWYKNKANVRGRFLNWDEIFVSYLKAPYEKYLTLIQSLKLENPKVLDLCCGMGEFSFDIARIVQGEVLAVDISEESIAICNQHLSEINQKNLKFKAADVEKLQLPKQSFDIICMSGSLSYLNLDIFLDNIKKWLKSDGCLIIVDTYGYSPVFNLKRKLNYLFRKTTKQTVLGIPKKETIEKVRNCFEYSEVSFFGVFAFIGPFLKYIIGDRRTAKVVNFLDRKFSFLKKYAFKFVLFAQNIKSEK